MFNKLLLKYNKLNKPAKASLWFVFSSIIQKGIAFITTPIFTRILTTEEFGTISIYNSWLSILTIFATMELSTGVFNKAMIKYEDDRDGYTSSTLCLAFFISLAFFIIYLIGRCFWNKIFELNTAMMSMLFIEIIFSMAMSFWTSRRRFDFEYISVVAFTLSGNVIGTLLSVFLVLVNRNYRSEFRVLGIVLVHVVVFSWLYLLLFKKGKKFIQLHYWKYAVTYNLPLIPHYLSQQILNQSDRIMISKIIGSAAAAIYTVAYQIALVLNIITSAINASFAPWAYQCMKAEKYDEIGKKSFLIEIFLCSVCFLFSLFAPEFIYILGGKQYYSAVWVVPPVSMSIVFNMLYTLISNIAFYYEKTVFVMCGTLISALANIVLNAVFISRFGFVAAGYTTLGCYIIYSIVQYVFMLKICKEKSIDKPFNTLKIWSIAIVAVILSILSSLLYNYTIIRYFFIVLIAVVFFILRDKVVSILDIRKF